MNVLIENWTDKFPMVVLVMAMISWIIAGMLWHQRLPILLRITICIVSTVISMVVIGAFAVLLVSFPIIPDGNLQNAITQDFIGIFTAFAEIGLETIVIWMPVLLLRVILLTVRSRRQETL